MIRSRGHCNTMGTASTMACVAEALGMTRPGAAGTPAPDSSFTTTGAREIQFSNASADFEQKDYPAAAAVDGRPTWGDPGPLERYSETALRRVWGSVRFSWWLTMLLHRFPDQTEFDQRAQEQELYHLSQSALAQAAMAEQYVGLPY